jgi:hypothetical protein
MSAKRSRQQAAGSRSRRCWYHMHGVRILMQACASLLRRHVRDHEPPAARS